MSKQTDAKAAQGYQNKPVFPVCSNCRHFTSEAQVREGTFSTWTHETNLRCTIGGFKVMKMATCNEHELDMKA